MPKVRRSRSTPAAQTHFSTTPRMREEARLLASVKANQAKKNFNSTLRGLCLQTIIRNEATFTTEQGKAAVQHILSPSAKTCLLAELARPVFNRMRYRASKQRVVLVKSLIHEQLEEFDFSVLGCKHKKSEDQDFWQCLTEVAGPSLRTLQYERHHLGYKGLNRYLPYLAQMPHLQKLQLTRVLCKTREALLALATACPELKSLTLNLQVKSTSRQSSALHSLTNLEELNFYYQQQPTGPRNSNVDDELPLELLRALPNLKVYCGRADQLDIGQSLVWYDAEASTWDGLYGLEHLILFAHESLNSHKQFSNVRHVILVQRDEVYEDSTTLDCTQVFPHLGSINIKFWDFSRLALPLLATNGAGITTLILDKGKDPEDRRHLVNLELVLTHCSSLTSLTVRGAKLDRMGDLCYGAPGRIGLKSLFLLNVETRKRDFDTLLWLVSAPVLEELTLQDFATKLEAFNFAKREAENGTILTNLKKFKLSLYTAYSPRRWGSKRRHQESASAFAQAVLCSCPKLQQADVKLDMPLEEAKFLEQLVNIVNS